MFSNTLLLVGFSSNMSYNSLHDKKKVCPVRALGRPGGIKRFLLREKKKKTSSLRDKAFIYGGRLKYKVD